MNREEQLRMMRLEAQKELHRVRAMTQTYEAEILAHAYALVDECYDEKGDTGFQRTARDLDNDTKEQIARAVIFQVMRRHRLRHQPSE